MKAKAKPANGQPILVVDSEVVRHIRQHARSSNKAEICGVLIGQDRDHRIEVAACIEGENAEEAGAHVTFTQDTWEHIYAVKDKKYPDERIVGWYHSHPGFGVFLSEHDTFIHQNFFSSPGQVAWVFDPHSDEEGCFGWVDGKIERLTRIAVFDRRGGESAESGAKLDPKSAADAAEEEDEAPRKKQDAKTLRVRRMEVQDDSDRGTSSLEDLVFKVFFFLASATLGFVLCWQVFPHTVFVAVPVDPMTGQPLDPRIGQMLHDSQTESGADSGRRDPTKAAQPNPSDGSGQKGSDAKSK
ncbi:MAG TPA: Mov34/MPN/PAD-1 family protein [Candidatus Sulfotelmatobacter sp.]|jgi:proteasome lid subunit RPN8/RPN11|nr:Mov34/MPN/PAD-1 family protein [Candidatus Sulfotelmatobacter sp.]